VIAFKTDAWNWVSKVARAFAVLNKTGDSPIGYTDKDAKSVSTTSEGDIVKMSPLSSQNGSDFTTLFRPLNHSSIRGFSKSTLSTSILGSA
jgi:hypothetical protein